MSVDVRYFVFGIVFLDFASTYLAIRANPAIASFHIRVYHYGQPAPLQMLTHHRLELVYGHVGTVRHGAAFGQFSMSGGYAPERRCTCVVCHHVVRNCRSLQCGHRNALRFVPNGLRTLAI
jgi:hypothetical protein